MKAEQIIEVMDNTLNNPGENIILFIALMFILICLIFSPVILALFITDY